MLTKYQLANLDNMTPARAQVLFRKCREAGYSFEVSKITPALVKNRGEWAVWVLDDWDVFFHRGVYFTPDSSEQPTVDEDGDQFFSETLVKNTPRFRAYLGAIRAAYEHQLAKNEAANIALEHLGDAVKGLRVVGYRHSFIEFRVRREVFRGLGVVYYRIGVHYYPNETSPYTLYAHAVLQDYALKSYTGSVQLGVLGADEKSLAPRFLELVNTIKRDNPHDWLHRFYS